MTDKKRTIITMGVVVFISIIAITSILFGLKGMNKAKTAKNNFLYNPTIPINEIKEDKDKALYLILYQTNKKVDDYEFIEKKSNNLYVYWDKNTNECYEADLEQLLVKTTTNCR